MWYRGVGGDSRDKGGQMVSQENDLEFDEIFVKVKTEGSHLYGTN